MRSLLQAAAILASPAFAMFIPPLSHSSDSMATFPGISVFFSVPCHGCFDDSNEELDIELKIGSSSLGCQHSSVAVNGVGMLPGHLPLRLHANSTLGNLPQEVIAFWDMTCLNNEVSLVSFRIDQIHGQPPAEYHTGFSASFRQALSPEILRLEHMPVRNINDVRLVNDWTQPRYDNDFMVVVSSSTNYGSVLSEVQEELRQLHRTKAHIGRLHHKYMKQEQRVFELIKQDFRSCEGATCVFQTAVKKAPDFLELVKAHFKHYPEWVQRHNHQPPPVPGIQKQGDSAVAYSGHEIGDFVHNELDHNPDPMGDYGSESKQATAPLDETHTDDVPLHEPPTPPPSHFHGTELPPPPYWHHDPHPPPPPPTWHHHEGPARIHGGHPPWAGHHRPGHHGSGHHRPHFFHRHGPHRHPFFFSVGFILFLVAIASLLFKCIRVKTGLFRSQKRRRDCAARREECRNRAAYRRAAMRHRWRQWWSSFRRAESSDDYEEKRTRILRQEGILDDVMQSEIMDLRRAHEIVGGMVQGRESRQRTLPETHLGSSSQLPADPYMLQRQNTESSQMTDATLPLYQPPPPSYDQELEGDMSVVDGFLYTPSGSGSTPASSVIDCNSRMSFETDTTVTKG